MTKEEFERRIIGMQDTLYRVSATILYQPCDREDAIQECIYKALRKREHLRDDAAIESWVIRILINECYAILRRKRREQPMEFLPEPDALVPGPDADGDAFRLLFSLSREMRLPMVLTDRWTLLMAIVAIAGLLLAYFTRNKKEEEEEEEQLQAAEV